MGNSTGYYINEYTQADENKLSGIQPGAEVNVNADWNSSSGDSQILNKPSTFPPSAHSHDDLYYTEGEVTTLLSGKSDVSHLHTGTYAPALGSDDNYVTDAEKVKLSNLSGVNTGDQTNITGNAGTVTTINGKIAQGTNVTITGTGTNADPYVINSTGGGGTLKTKVVEVDFGGITQETNSVITTVSATDVTSTSVIIVNPSGVSTTDHDIEDYQWDNVHAYATNIVDGVGFDIIAYTDNMSWGKYKFNCLYT